MCAQLLYESQYFTTKLSVAGGIDASQTTSIVLQNVSGVSEPTKPGLCLLSYADPLDTTAAEWVTYTSVNTTTKELVGVTRGQEGSSGKVHLNGVAIAFPHSIAHINRINDKLTGVDPIVGATLTSPTVNTPTINGTITLDTAAQTSITDLNAGSLFKQSLLNGNQDVWQRGTSVALTAANGYTADRWYVETATAGTDKTVSREDGTGVNGSYYCARVKFVSDVDELLTFSQALESQDSIKFRGKKLTLSFYARGGAEFVADNATLVSKIVTGKGTDQKVLAFTTSADAVSQNNTLTTGWQKFTCTTTEVIAADITQLGVSFAFTHAGSGTTSNYFEITQVQLCAGDVALPFQPKRYEEELRACQRYCKAYTSTSSNDIVTHGVAVSATVAYVYFFFDTPMRVAPTITATAGDWKIGFPSGALQDVTGITGGSGFDSDRAFMANVTTASGLTAGYPQILVNDGGGTRTLILDAEL